MSGFERVWEAAVLRGKCTATRLRSRASGLSVFVAQFPSPITQLAITVATPTLSNAGEPHTLEHLCFLGSELHPYKGVLDLVANASFARGTNAYTEVDHTAYTVSCAGSEGFLRLLPLYLDHVVRPTLTADGFVTEVHHITGEGKSAGVVYSEMEAIENTGPTRVSHAVAQALWAGTAYATETGGRLADVRGLTLERIKAFHTAHYHPANLCVVVAGDVAADAVCAALAQLDAEFAKALGPTAPGDPRALLRDLPPLAGPATVAVDFPADDEDGGALVELAWRGPRGDDAETQQRVDLLLTYLAISTVAPLRAQLVDCKRALCGDVDAELHPGAVCSISIRLSHLASAAAVAAAEAKVMSVLRGVVAIDMQRMAEVVAAERLSVEHELESETADAIVLAQTYAFLHAAPDPSGDAERRYFVGCLDGQFKALDSAAALGEADWLALLRRWLLDPPHVTVVGTPSAAAAAAVREEVEARRAATVEQVGGAEGLAACAARVEAARAANEAPIPPATRDALAAAFPIPPAASVRFAPAAVGPPPPPPEGAPAWPVRCTVVDMPGTTRFARVAVAFDTTGIDESHRRFLPLLSEATFELPIAAPAGPGPGGAAAKREMGMEEVVRRLHAETVSFTVGLGVSQTVMPEGPLDSAAAWVAELTVPVEEYAAGVAWLVDCVWHPKLDPARLAIAAVRLAESIPATRRSAEALLACAGAVCEYPGGVNFNVCSPLAQRPFLLTVIGTLSSKKDAPLVLRGLQTLRSQLITPARCRVFVGLDLAALPGGAAALVAPWAARLAPPAVLADVAVPQTCAAASASEGGRPVRSAVVPLASTDSAYLTVWGPGPAGHTRERVATGVVCEALSACEGPLWVAVRGAGLAYGCDVYAVSEARRTQAVVYRSASPGEALAKVGAVCREFVGGFAELPQRTLDAAKSGRVCAIAQGQSSPDAIFSTELTTALSGGPPLYSRGALAMLDTLTRDELAAAATAYIAPLFAGGPAVCAVAVAAVGKADATAAAIREVAGVEAAKVTLTELFGEGVEDSDDEEEEDEEEEEEDEEEGWEDEEEEEAKPPPKPAGKKGAKKN